jgi:hypothetical protein
MMTVDKAIEVLTEARKTVGGDAPILMADELPVVSFPLGEDCVYVCDVPDEPDDEGATAPEPCFEVTWDYDTGRCGVAQVNVSDSNGRPLFECSIPGKTLFKGDERAAQTALESAKRDLHRLWEQSADPCVVGPLRDYITVLHGALAKYTGPRAEQPISAGR